MTEESLRVVLSVLKVERDRLESFKKINMIGISEADLLIKVERAIKEIEAALK